MLVKRIKFFTKADKIIYNKSKELFNDLINKDGTYKALEKLKDLSTRDKVNLVKRLPNYISDKSLRDDKGLIKVPEEVFNSLKKSDYFKDQDITLEQFNRGLNKHFNLNNYNKDLVKYLKDDKNKGKISIIKDKVKVSTPSTSPNTPLYEFDIHDRVLKKMNNEAFSVNTKDVIKNYERYNSKNVTGNTKPITAREMDYGNNAYFLKNIPTRRFALNMTKLNLKLGKIFDPKNKKGYDEMLKMVKETDKQGMSRNGGDVYIPKDRVAIGLVDHEYGHALNFERGRDKRSVLKKIKDFVKNLLSSKEEKAKKKEMDSFRDSLRSPMHRQTNLKKSSFKKNNFGIDQLGEEAAASLRGLSRVKGDKQKAELLLGDAYSTYVDANADNILKSDATLNNLI